MRLGFIEVSPVQCWRYVQFICVCILALPLRWCWYIMSMICWIYRTSTTTIFPLLKYVSAMFPISRSSIYSVTFFTYVFGKQYLLGLTNYRGNNADVWILFWLQNIGFDKLWTFIYLGNVKMMCSRKNSPPKLFVFDMHNKHLTSNKPPPPRYVLIFVDLFSLRVDIYRKSSCGC